MVEICLESSLSSNATLMILQGVCGKGLVNVCRADEESGSR